MINKETDYQLAKLQKQIDRNKKSQKSITNVIYPVQPETLLSKPVADDIKVVDGQTLVYNKKDARWEPGNAGGGGGLSQPQIMARSLGC